MSADTALDLTLPGRRFATAWLNAWLSTSDDDERPVLYRTLVVEVFDGWVQLFATDSYTMLAAAAPCVGHEDEDGPSLDEVPPHQIVVMDHDNRAPTLLRWLLADCKAAAKDGMDEPTVHLSVRSAEVPDAPTLDPTLDRQQLVLTTDRERLTFDIFDGEYPPWRRLILGHTPKPTDTIALNPKYLARLGKIRDTDSCPIEFTLAGPLGMATISVAGDSPLFGCIMPVRVLGGEDE